jgi:hypothetical protein
MASLIKIILPLIIGVLVGFVWGIKWYEKNEKDDREKGVVRVKMGPLS